MVHESTSGSSPTSSSWGRLTERLFAPSDVAPLVFFRVAFGVVMFWEVFRFFDHGWIRRYYISPQFNFKYFGFEWLEAWPGMGMYIHFYALAVLAAMIAVGLWYRVATTLFFFAFSYVFLLEQARYLNHFYLIILISFLMIWIPAHRDMSIDAARSRQWRSATVPTWPLWLLRAQIGIVYFYGGLAKINHDWLRGEPMRHWLAGKTDYPLIGQFFREEWMVYAFSYGGLLLDLLITPFLLWKRTRLAAFLVALLFHLMNARLFQIGIFPWFMIAATMIFFPPESFRRVLPGLFSLRRRATAAGSALGAVPAALLSHRRLVLTGLSIFLSLQLLVPLRHFLYPSKVHWSEEGHRFAWHMKLRNKRAKAVFLVTRNQGPVEEVNPRDYLKRWQARKMSTRPDMILQFAHFLEDEFRRQPDDVVEVRARVWAELNYGQRSWLIDESVDLAAVRRPLTPAPWILPFNEHPVRPKSVEPPATQPARIHVETSPGS